MYAEIRNIKVMINTTL